jgi:hypothetical protein
VCRLLRGVSMASPQVATWQRTSTTKPTRTQMSLSRQLICAVAPKGGTRCRQQRLDRSASATATPNTAPHLTLTVGTTVDM